MISIRKVRGRPIVKEKNPTQKSFGKKNSKCYKCGKNGHFGFFFIKYIYIYIYKRLLIGAPNSCIYVRTLFSLLNFFL